MRVGGGRVNQPDVSPIRLCKDRRALQKCLSPRDFCRSAQPQAPACFGPGNEVWLSSIQKENGDVDILVVKDRGLIREVAAWRSRGGQGRYQSVPCYESWIASSTSASDVGGTSMPKARAVCRLMLNSNVTACMTATCSPVFHICDECHSKAAHTFRGCASVGTSKFRRNAHLSALEARPHWSRGGASMLFAVAGIRFGLPS
jgi:hypothetical protein